MNTAYSLIPITVLILLFYAISYLLVRIGVMEKTSHRKFWNVLLLTTFFVAGLLGLFLVIKINYKLEISFYDELMVYHVDFGIGMAIIGFFHFWWHLKYYLNLLKGKPTSEEVVPVSEVKEVSKSNKQIIKPAAILLGVSSMIAQIILLREFLTVFNGNELVVGLVLTSWLVLTGIGALLGRKYVYRKKPLVAIIPGLLIISVLPFLTAFAINFLKNLVFPVGAMINIFQIFFSSFLLLIPFCLVSGFLFTVLAGYLSETEDENLAGTIYGYESIGSIVGGLLSGYLFIFIFSSIESLLILAILNGLILFIFGIRMKRIRNAIFSLAIVFFAFVLLFLNPELKIRSFVYPNQKVLISKDSPYGNIVITSQESQLNVYNNNKLQFDSGNSILNEEAVHFTMLQHANPKNILLVSGGLAGQIRELQKYPLAHIDYVENNKWLLKLLKDSVDNLDPQIIELHSKDPVRFIEKTKQVYDVAILNLPEPSSLQANRFYTEGFYLLLKSKLNANGVVSFGLLPSANYINQESVNLLSSVFCTLKNVFKNVIVIPGEKNYFLASDADLTYNIANAIKDRNLENQFVNQYYIDDFLLQDRGSQILNTLNPNASINQNLKPVTYRHQLSYWLSYFKTNYWMFAVLLAAFSFFIFLKGGRYSKTMFVTGFSATGLEVLLLFGLQIYFGNIYLLTSFVFTGFMIGLAAGAFLGKRFINKNIQNRIVQNQLLIAAFSLLVIVFIYIPDQYEIVSGIIYTAFLIAVIVSGVLTGLQFTLANLVQKGNFGDISGKIYSCDLFGSAAGALAVSLFLVPVFGIVWSFFFIGSINLVFAFYLYLMKK